MNGNNAVLDSNFLIFLSKGLIDLELLRSRYNNLLVSIITYIEVYAYDFKDENQKNILDKTFDRLEILEVDAEIADQTIIYRKSKIKKIKLPDAIILATAKMQDADLITNNLVDFQGIDSSVLIVGIDDLRV
jgi:predicted nucleic acid-binding protein